MSFMFSNEECFINRTSSISFWQKENCLALYTTVMVLISNHRRPFSIWNMIRIKVIFKAKSLWYIYFFTSIWEILILHMQAYANSNLTTSSLATSAYVSSKSMPSSWLYPLATSLALFLTIFCLHPFYFWTPICTKYIHFIISRN